MFRPLKNLLGATVTIAEDLKGVMVTTQRGLAIQRFTLAHELGHVILGHEQSLDENVGFSGRFGGDSLPTQEIAADTFASELLAPKSLMLSFAKRQKWRVEGLSNPDNIYQLSLRLGISFQATCWALAAHKGINFKTASRIHSTKPKELKQHILSPKYLTNPWADVWKITENDSDTILEAGPDDIFALQLNENSAAGYLWELIDAGQESEIVADLSNFTPERIGGSVYRQVLLRFPTPGVHRLYFEHRRPWSGEKIGIIDISINSSGKEVDGLPRRMKNRLLYAEAA